MLTVGTPLSWRSSLPFLKVVFRNQCSCTAHMYPTLSYLFSFDSLHV